MPFMRPCLEEQVIFVRASNASSSTGAIVDPYIEVELDPAITIDSASMAFDDLGNDLYRFDIDNLNPGHAERIVIYTISCDVNLGETLCMEANLPVEACVLDDIPSDPIDGDDGIIFPWNVPYPGTNQVWLLKVGAPMTRLFFSDQHGYLETVIWIAIPRYGSLLMILVTITDSIRMMEVLL